MYGGNTRAVKTGKKKKKKKKVPMLTCNVKQLNFTGNLLSRISWKVKISKIKLP